MVQNIPEEVALDTYNNDNEYHPSDKDTVHEKHEEQEMDSRSAASGKTESERIMTSSEGKKDKGPATYQLIFITIALVLAVFCVSLVSKYESTPRDNTIVATAIPSITEYFHALDDVGWYGSAYMLTNCAFQLLYGKIYSSYSTKWVFLISLGIFEIGSLVCGAAPSSTALILGRAVAGLGGSGITTGAFLIISQTVPLEKRPIYTSAVTSVFAVSSVLGPVLGGIFADRLSWRWCFYINLPFGGVTALFLFFLVKPQKEKLPGITSLQDLRKFDIPGTIVFLPGIVCLLLALQWGGSKYPWHNWHVIVTFVMGGVLICAFILIQYWQQENATLPPRIIKNRNVWGAWLYSFTILSAMFVVVYYASSPSPFEPHL
ncbi:uncharacterized protein BHQ10_009280 [Talaromyces amestolkiae]|uniref:Major facilitator superfamily (MFS) profile domain-containing protein n=1 Tax=Talaromyces amestolkiae TaxID=1196081 RepID=A0A364LBT8_TALAM|nr:uncharacterized protein BHQ10_009280 [Talaromyces amestolkiae]RAO73268.1 hypothetical protein BHQ10_009280 [Talaromyces amestolkiae]